MNRGNILSSIWARLIAFIWFIIFPLFAFLIPVFEMLFEEREVSMTPIYGFLVWILGPIVGLIILKNFFGWKNAPPNNETEKQEEQ